MKEILTKQEVADILQVSRKYVQRLIADRKIQCSRLGHRTVRIRRTEVDRYLRRYLQ